VKPPSELDSIDWAELEPVRVRLGGKPAIPRMIRLFYAGESLEKRLEALGEAWNQVMTGPWKSLGIAAPALVRCVLPTLADDSDAALPALLDCLGDLCRDALKHPNALDSARISDETLRAIESGFPNYLRLFQSRPELRGVIARILTAYPHRSDSYVLLLIDEYEGNRDRFVRSELLFLMARISEWITGWRTLVTEAAAPDSPMPLRYIASAELVRLEGDNAPPEARAFLATRLKSEVEQPPRTWRLWAYSAPESLKAASRSLSQNSRISLLVQCLQMEVRHSSGAYDDAVLLLESLYDGDSLVKLLGIDCKEGDPKQVYNFKWIGPARDHDLRFETQASDWLGALVSAERLWDDDHPPLPELRRIETNLFFLFGLPTTREGLIKLWESVHGEPWRPLQ
jgi:hypothetical protein